MLSGRCLDGCVGCGQAAPAARAAAPASDWADGRRRVDFRGHLADRAVRHGCGTLGDRIGCRHQDCRSRKPSRQGGRAGWCGRRAGSRRLGSSHRADCRRNSDNLRRYVRVALGGTVGHRWRARGDGPRPRGIYCRGGVRDAGRACGRTSARAGVT